MNNFLELSHNSLSKSDNDSLTPPAEFPFLLQQDQAMVPHKLFGSFLPNAANKSAGALGISAPENMFCKAGSM